MIITDNSRIYFEAYKVNRKKAIDLLSRTYDVDRSKIGDAYFIWWYKIVGQPVLFKSEDLDEFVISI